jgi:transcription factor SPN1
MSDSDDDIFGGSSDSGGDTDELIAASKSKAPAIAKKKTNKASNDSKAKAKATSKAGPKKLGAARLKKKQAIPDADADSDDEAGGLFDSDDEDAKGGTAAAKGDTGTAGSPPAEMSKKERMEALKKRARKAAGLEGGPKKSSKEKGTKDKPGDDGEKEKGYNSGDSYDSGDYNRTKEDDDFIDVEGEDEEVVKEYYKEQIFDDERPDGSDDEMEVQGKGKGKKGSKRRNRGPDDLDEADRNDQDNPMMEAVNRMKKRKKLVKTFEELKVIAEEFVAKMEYTADQDDLAIKERRPGMKKMLMLTEAMAMMTNSDMVRPLLESDVLSAIKRWIQPLPNGSLGNVTVRQRMIEVVAKMGTGEDHGIDTDDLKKSGFGKLVMVLYNHKKETPGMKKLLRKLIEEWSRTIFGKSGNMKDLAKVGRRPNTGLTGYALAASGSAAAEQQKPQQSVKRENNGDLGDVISSKVKQGRDSGKNRVRIPYSKGFQYTVRPSDVQGDITDKKTRIANVADKRESLHKRMLEKQRPVNKNSRSANVSIGGKPTK